MSILVLVVIFGVAFAYFATENTLLTNLTIGGLQYDIPLYLVILGSLLLGLVIAWVINTIEWAGSTLSIHDKEHQIKQTQNKIIELQNSLQRLELENARLRTVEKEPETKTQYVEVVRKPNLLDRLRASFST